MKTLFGIFTLSFLTSCGNSVEFKDGSIPKFQDTFPIAELNFSNVSNQMFKPNCVQCHRGYEDYGAVFNDKDKILDAVLTGRMPKNAPALSDDLKALLNAWIGQGAPLGEGNSPPPPIELTATWSSLSKKVFFPKCVQCHNSSGQAKFLDLSSRQKFFEQRHELLNNFEDVENSYLVEVITDPEEPMPPPWSDIGRLSEEEVATIVEWIKKGLP